MAYQWKARDKTTPGANYWTDVAVALLLNEQLVADIAEVETHLADIKNTVVVLTGADPGTYSPDFPDVANVTTDDTVDGVPGTLDMSLYTEISGVVSADAVQKGVPRYSGGDNGTLVGCVDAVGTLWSYPGILDSAGDFNSDGVLDNAGTWHSEGMLSGAHIYYSYGTLDSSAVYHATGVIYGTGDYATEASRNTDPGEAYVLTGHDYTILGAAKTASYSPDFPDVGNVLTTDTVNGSAGTFNATNLSVGNVIQDVAFGVGLTGTGANLLATHTTYLSLEAGRNSATAGANQILTGYSVTIAGVTTNGTYVAIGANNALHTGSGYYGAGGALDGNYYGPSSQAGVTTTTTYGVGNATSGTLNMTLYCLISGITWPALDEVDGGVHFGPTTGTEYEGTGVNATTVAAAILATPENKLATDASGAVTPTAASKTGYSLAATGLDAITATRPSGKATTFPQMLVQLFYRFFGKATKTGTQIKTYAADGTTVVTTQTVSDDGTTETQGEAS